MNGPPRLVAVVGRLSNLTNELGARCEGVEAQSDDPFLYSAMLFLRLCTNLRGYMLLWHDGSYLNADILLRSIVECTICLAAISATGAGFIEQVRADAASSLKGAIKSWREEEFMELVQRGGKHLREVFDAETGEASGPLNWKELAEKAGHPRLYNMHRMLSMASAHLTGLSLLRMIDDPSERSAAGTNRLNEASGSYNFAAMASIVALACGSTPRMTAGTTHPWRASSTPSRPSGSITESTPRATRRGGICSDTSRASTIPVACTQPWATSAQRTWSVERLNPVHFFGGRSR